MALIACGKSFSRRQVLRVAIRVEHVSNRGLREANPGLDSSGLGFTFGVGRSLRVLQDTRILIPLLPLPYAASATPGSAS